MAVMGASSKTSTSVTSSTVVARILCFRGTLTMVPMSPAMGTAKAHLVCTRARARIFLQTQVAGPGRHLSYIEPALCSNAAAGQILRAPPDYRRTGVSCRASDSNRECLGWANEWRPNSMCAFFPRG